MSTNKETYDEQVKAELAAKTAGSENHDPLNSDIHDFGKVNLAARSPQANVNNDETIIKLNSMLDDWVNIPMSTLPSLGQFYPKNATIKIRAALVREVREFSAVNENDPIDVNDKLDYIMRNCCKIYYGGQQGRIGDILNMDRLKLILLIRERTFANETITVPIPAGSCSTPGCTPDATIQIRVMNQRLECPTDDFLEKYYDESKRCYTFKTKNHGEFSMRPTTIGAASALVKYRQHQIQENKPVDTALLRLAQYFVDDYTQLNDKYIFSLLTEFDSWNAEKFATIDSCASKIESRSIPELITTCSKCGGEIRVPFNFQLGIREIFVPNVPSNSDNEFI